MKHYDPDNDKWKLVYDPREGGYIWTLWAWEKCPPNFILICFVPPWLHIGDFGDIIKKELKKIQHEFD